jgi:hypothetical protein
MIRLPRAAAFAAVFAIALAGANAALSAQASPDPNIKKSDYSLPDIPKEKPGVLPSPGFQSSAPIRFSMRYRMVSQGEPDSKWIDLPEQITLPGQKVQLKLTHPTLVVLSELFPLPVSPAAVRLRAFNQIWIAQVKGELTYMTSQSAATVAYGEEVFFYPLGSQSYTSGILQMSITMNLAAEEKK